MNAKKLILSLFTCILLNFYINAQTPNFTWAKNIGGTGNNSGRSVKIDAAGNVYSTGYFSATNDFDPGAGTTNLNSFGLNDIYISKLDASGNFLWAKQLGGTNDDYGYSLDVDASNNIYITGSFSGTADFDPGVGTYTLSSAGGSDIFICKLSAAGNFIWAKKIGGTTTDEANGLTVDGSGNVFTTGDFSGTVDFNPGAGTFNLVGVGGDIFVSKLDSSGNFVWATKMGGTTLDIGQSIKLDASGNVYTTGYFKGTMPVGTTTLTSVGAEDIFICKMNALGNFVWAGGVGGTGIDQGFSLAVDANGNSFITGEFVNLVDFAPGAGSFDMTSSGSGANEDIFVLKLDVSGNFVWAVQMGGGSLGDIGYSIALDNSGNVYTTGVFFSTTDFDPGAATQNLTSNGGGDIFISKLDPSGNYIWAGKIGGATTDRAYSIALDANNNLYCTGYFQNTVDFDAGAGVFNIASGAGLNDIFVTKYCNQSPSQPGIINGGVSICNGAINTYSISQVTDATSYTWVLPGGWSGTSTTNTISATASSTSGTISVTANNACGSSVIQTVSVTVNTTPTITVNSGAICSGQSFTITPSGANTYTFSSGSAVVTPTTTSSYSITGTSTQGCVSSSPAISSVTVNSLPVITVNSGTICSGQSFTMSPSGASTYTYSSGSAIVTPTANASYNVTGTSTQGCVSSWPAISNVTVNTTPTITINSGAICSGQSFTMSPSGASTYTFSSVSAIVTPTANATYSVSGTSSQGCVSASPAISNVTVNLLPTVSYTQNPNTICVTSSAITLSTGSPVGGTYTGTAVTGNSFDPATAGTGTFTIMYSYTDGNNCANTATDNIVVSGCAGVSQISGLNSQISVYPNPFSSIVTLSGIEGHTQVTVHNVLGEKVKELSLNSSTNIIDLQDLASGVYYLQVGRRQLKIIKQ